MVPLIIGIRNSRDKIWPMIKSKCVLINMPLKTPSAVLLNNRIPIGLPQSNFHPETSREGTIPVEAFVISNIHIVTFAV